jgi:hypothetical protein
VSRLSDRRRAGHRGLARHCDGRDRPLEIASVLLASRRRRALGERGMEKLVFKGLVDPGWFVRYFTIF